MYKLRMTEMQKAYYLGRNEENNGGVGTHLYVELIYKGGEKELKNTVQKIIDSQPIFRAKALDTFEFEVQDSLSYDIQVFQTDCNDEKVLSKIRDKYETKVYGKEDFPLFDIFLVGKKNEYCLCASIDMLIADGLSLYTLAQDLATSIYESDKIFPDQTENLKYMVDYYYDRRMSKRYFMARDYYMSMLDELKQAPQMSYLEDNTNPHFGHLEFQSDNSFYSIINEKAKTHGVSPSDIVYTIYAMVLARWSRYNEFSVNMTTFIRPTGKQYRKVYGDFTTSMLVQTSVKFDEDFYSNVKRNKRACFQAYRNSSFEVSEIVSEMNKTTRGVLMPIVYTSMLFNKDELNQEGLYIDYWRSQTPQVYLDCQVKNVNGSLNITWDYRENKFRRNHILGMFEDMKALLNKFCSSDEDVTNWYFKTCHNSMKKMYATYNADEIEYVKNNETLKALFEKTVVKYPEKTFISIGNEKYLFSEIYACSKKVADEFSKLMEQHGKNKTRVVFQGYKHVESIVYIVAAVLSGNSFCVLNKEYSEKKVREILIGLDNYIFVEPDGKCVCSVSKKEIPANESYILFTSGTTGKPKGIQIEECAVLNTVRTIDQMYHVSSDDVFLNISNLYFDLSVYDIMSSMINGSEIVMVEALDSEDVKEHLSNITIWNSTPALVKEYAIKNDVPNIRLFLISGDFVPKNLVEDIYLKYGNDLRVIALGGATEASIWSNYYDCKNYDKVKTIPYGRALYKQTMYVMNPENGALCNENVVGEICIGGEGLAKGYLDSEQTKEAFIMHEGLGKRIYKTGDLGYMGSDQQVYIIGRVAQEIKHNGYRIDLKEIENEIAMLDGVNMAVVMLERLENGRTKLLAVIESNQREIDQVVRSKLTKRFPYYMVPTQMIVTKKIPLTQNGKVDKKEMLTWFVGEDYVDEFTEEEKCVLKIWKEVIGSQNFRTITSRESTYFDAGGQSLQAVELKNAIDSAYHASVSLQDIISHISLRSMTELITELTIKNNENRESGAVENLGELHTVFDPIGNAYLKTHEVDKSIFVNQNLLEEYRHTVKSRIMKSSDSEHNLDLFDVEWNKDYIERHSTRNFLMNKLVSFDSFKSLMTLLIQREGHYSYPSAGGLYPLDVYVSVKNNRVENVQGGTYYVSPAEGKLVYISENIISREVHFFTNAEIFDTSAFSVHLIFNVNASMPKYDGMAYYYAGMEAGIISTVLANEGMKHDLGNCIIGDADGNKIKEKLQCGEDEIYLVSMEFGYEDMEQLNEEGELVLLREGTTDKNIVLIHAGSGEINNYLLLSRKISPNYNIYAIKQSHNFDILKPKEYNFKNYAKQYHKLLCKLDHIDVIGGWCIGGTIAYEMSLLDSKKYPKLLMINTKAPVRVAEDADFDLETEKEVIKDFVGLDEIVKDCNSVDEVWAKVCKVMEDDALRKIFVSKIPNLLLRLLPTPDKLTANQLIHYINTFRASEHARNIYHGEGKTNSQILYLYANEEPLENFRDWANFTNQYEEKEIRGNHVSIFTEESVNVWKEYIEVYLG